MNAVIKKTINFTVILSFLYISGMLFGYYNAGLRDYSRVRKIKNKINYLYSENRVKISDNISSEIAKSIIRSSAQYHIDENMILAIIKCESDFNPFETSYINAAPLAMGLMQVNFTANAWGNIFTNRGKYYDIYYNVDCGSCIFSCLSKAEDNDAFKALVKYNGGYEIHAGKKTVYNSGSSYYAKNVLKFKGELDRLDNR
jgi:soluble lytic murein transglycosylase-like protein